MRTSKGHDNHKIRVTTVSFRVTLEERMAIEARIKVCGIPKGEYYRQSLLYQSINITAGRYHSDRLAMEIRRMRETLEKLTEIEDAADTIKECDALLMQINEIGKGSR